MDAAANEENGPFKASNEHDASATQAPAWQ